MRAWIVALSLVASPALAQDVGATMYVVADVEATRFVDADTKGPPLAAGDEVTVVHVEGDRVRILEGKEFGWVPATALTAVDPNPAPITLGGSGGPPREFSMEALQELLDRTKTP